MALSDCIDSREMPNPNGSLPVWQCLPEKLLGNFRFGVSRGNSAAIQFNGNLALMLGTLSGRQQGRWPAVVRTSLRIGTHHAAA